MSIVRILAVWLVVAAASILSLSSGSALSDPACTKGSIPSLSNAKEFAHKSKCKGGFSPCASANAGNRRYIQLRLRGGGEAIRPTVWWSQRANSVVLKVDMPPGIHDASGLSVGEKTLTWNHGDIRLDLELFAALDANSAKVISDGGRQVTIHVLKATSAWWPRLTSGPKPVNVKVDWSTWKDEDEADEAGPGDQDFNYDDDAMGSLAGMEGLGKGPGKGGKWADDDDQGKGGDDKGDGDEAMEDPGEMEDNGPPA